MAKYNRQFFKYQVSLPGSDIDCSHQLTLYEENITIKTKFKNLGMILDKELKYKEHIEETMRKMFRVIGQLYCL